jgi:chromosome segregation ATPase
MVKEKEQVNTAEAEDGGDEADTLRQENESLKRELESRESTINRLEQTLANMESEITSLTQAMDSAKQANDELGQVLARAVAAYKEMVVQSNPGLLPEMISGDTIEEIDESVKKARAVMERVRQEIEAEAARTKVPAGAPPRSPLDLSGLSAREKIQYAIRGSSS